MTPASLDIPDQDVAGGSGHEPRADLEQQLDLQRQHLRPGGGELRRGGARFAAVRTGSQPVLFVFAAGNGGGGEDNGGGGDPDTILSPGTAKNVITVGALEQLRNITNIVTNVGWHGQHAVWQDGTDSDNQVAGFSARGNVGIGTEGDFGRFKPDVVAPGTFVVSTRSAQWDTNAYYNPTNITFNEFAGQVVDPNTLNYYPITVPANAVAVNIFIVPNAASSFPFPTNLPIYVSETGFPNDHGE